MTEESIHLFITEALLQVIFIYTSKASSSEIVKNSYQITYLHVVNIHITLIILEY